METKTKDSIFMMAVTAVMAALIAVVAPFSIPAGQVSFTLCTLLLYLSPYILGWKRAALATLIYIMLGMVGMPVFSGFKGGFGVLAGPTGGYILGYIPMVIVGGLFIKLFPRNRALQFAGMVLATAVLYALGTAMFCVQMQATLEVALINCVFPFIPFDLGKMAVVIVFGPLLQERLAKAGIQLEVYQVPPGAVCARGEYCVLS